MIKPIMANTNHQESSPGFATNTVPFDQAYWVIAGKLMAGCFPGSENPAESDLYIVRFAHNWNDGILE